MMELIYNKEQIFDSYARHSVVAERSIQAVDKSEKSIMSEIVFKEQERLGFSDRVLSDEDDGVAG